MTLDELEVEATRRPLVYLEPATALAIIAVVRAADAMAQPSDLDSRYYNETHTAYRAARAQLEQSP